MRAYLTIILIGLVSAFIGIIPLFKRKADKYTVLSAFVLFLIMPYVISGTYFFGAGGTVVIFLLLVFH